MANRKEDYIRIKDNISVFIEKHFGHETGLRCILDLSCLPSYFFLRLLRDILENQRIHDFIIVYTKPSEYCKGHLKFSPPDKTKPDFLPFFGRATGDVNWIVCLGFDLDSVQNAEKILNETLHVTDVHAILPFPAYQPDFLIRTMTENKEIIQAKNIYYTPADNPFSAYSRIREITASGDNFILSTFGPKPIALGMGLAAIELNRPILHVQATDYNPDFSKGQRETLAYIIKYKGQLSWKN